MIHLVWGGRPLLELTAKGCLRLGQALVAVARMQLWLERCRPDEEHQREPIELSADEYGARDMRRRKAPA